MGAKPAKKEEAKEVVRKALDITGSWGRFALGETLQFIDGGCDVAAQISVAREPKINTKTGMYNMQCEGVFIFGDGKACPFYKYEGKVQLTSLSWLEAATVKSWKRLSLR